jgi:hypothetical protein
MTILRYTFLLLFFLICGKSTLGQDKITLLNGQVLEVKVKSETDGDIVYFYEKRNKKKESKLESYRVFSVEKKGEQEKIIYAQDTAIGNYFSVDEMRMFIYGERDARNNYKTGWFYAGSAVLGYAAVMFDTYDSELGFFKSEPSIFPIVLPLVFPIVSAKINTKIQPRHVSESAYLLNTEYIDGFKKVARFKRMKSTLLGTVTGVGLGIATYFIAR